MTTKLRAILSVVIAVGVAAAGGIWADTVPNAAKSGPSAVNASAFVMNPFEIMLKNGKDLPASNPADPI